MINVHTHSGSVYEFDGERFRLQAKEGAPAHRTEWRELHSMPFIQVGYCAIFHHDGGYTTTSIVESIEEVSGVHRIGGK